MDRMNKLISIHFYNLLTEPVLYDNKHNVTNVSTSTRIFCEATRQAKLICHMAVWYNG